MFARKADDDLASFARKLDEVVSKNRDKKACGTVICLGEMNAFAQTLEKIAKDQKLASVPLTVAKDGASGPRRYRINKDVTFTVVVYDDQKKVTASFAFEKLDAKAQDAAFAAFAKVLGIDPPKTADAKKDEKSEKREPD